MKKNGIARAIDYGKNLTKELNPKIHYLEGYNQAVEDYNSIEVDAIQDVLTTEIMVLRERNLQIMVEHLRSEWKPKTKPSEFEIYHGSQKGEVKSIIQYWDEYKCTWTDKESAFIGYVFNAIKEFIKL